MADYTSLSLEELEDQYKEALDNNVSQTILSEFVQEFQRRNIDAPYISQTGVVRNRVDTEEQELIWQIEQLKFSIGADRSDAGMILPTE